MSLPIELVNDFYLEVVRGNVLGFSALEIVGQNSALDGTEDVWNAGATQKTILQVSTAALLYVSSSAADTTQTVTITGLDDNYDVITEAVVLDGTTPVPTTQAFLRVNSATIDIAPAGTVYIYYYCTDTAGVPDDVDHIQALINIAALQAYNAIYTVPRNKTMYMTGLRYASTASNAAHDVVLSVIRKVYGGANETVKTVKYLDIETAYTDEQIQMTDHPVEFPAKSEFRVSAALAGGTALNISVLVSCVEEVAEVSDAVVDVMDKASYLAFLAAETHAIVSVTYYLIGLNEEPTSLPSTAALGNALTTITGHTNYTVAADTTVTFDANYFVNGDKLILTNKKAVLTIMRCVDDHPMVKYVLAPVNTVVNISNVKKLTYLHN